MAANTGRQQLILFDWGVLSRSNSLAQPLDEVPIRYAHDRPGNRVAILDSRGLRLCHRQCWKTEGPLFLTTQVYQWADQGKFDEMEKLLSIIGSQDRLGFGRTSEQLRTQIIASLGARWRYLADNHPEEESFQRLERWREDGSQLALVANGKRHYVHAWNARGGGFANSVTNQGWEGFEKHLKIAINDLDQAIEMGDPPLLALDIRLQPGLEQGEDLRDVDPLCRLASEAYPGELAPHDSIAFKLTPQWFGEPGDVLSFALSETACAVESRSAFVAECTTLTSCG